MEKKWLNKYPKGIPAEVDVKEFSSVVELFQHGVEKYGHKPAFANMGRVFSYAEMDEKSRALAAFLQQDLGLQKGERVAIMMPNLLQYPVSIFAVLRAGLIVVNVNPLYTHRELQYQLNDSGASVIVILENFAHVLADILPNTVIKKVIITRLGDLLSYPKSVLINVAVKYLKRMVPRFYIQDAIDFNQALATGGSREYKQREVTGEDVAFLQYTAGTTGVSKGAMLTHRNIVANVVQASAWIAPFVKEGSEVIITALPLYHIFSLTANCLLFLNLGGLNYLITNPRDMKGFVRELRHIKFTAITGVNTLFNGLLNTPGFADLDFSSLHISLGGGMAIQSVTARRWKEVTGNTLIEAYGLTEASPGVCINPFDLEDYNGKVGLPIPSTECSIQDEKRQMLAAGETGELCVRGPQVMRGYWNRPKETEKVLSADGWLHTGDFGVMDDDGNFRVIERKDDMIVVSGFNVYPSEIEAVVAEHPGVLEAAAIGVADARSGEVVKLFVVKKDPALTIDALKDFCRQNLAAYKVPKYIEFCDSLPKTNVGKILHRALRIEER